jgi:Tetratricopeptide repeat
MSVPVAKGVKRSATTSTSRRTSAASVSKSRALAGKSARPKPLVKRASADKAPVRKATRNAVPTPPKSKPAKRTTPTKKVAAKPSAKGKSVSTKALAAKKLVAIKKAPIRTVVTAKAAAKRIAKPSVARKPAVAKNMSADTRNSVKAVKPKLPVKQVAAKPVAPSTQTIAQKPPAKLTVQARTLTFPAKRTVKPLPPKPPGLDELAALKAFETARKEFGTGKFAESRVLFKALIDKFPGASEVTARARTYLNIAESRLQTSIALPRDADSLYDRGVIELNRGDYVAAQEMFERALRKEPNAAHVYYGLAATRARLGSVEAALQSLNKAIELLPTLRIRAQHDQDLLVLRNDPEFDQLVFASR